LKTTAALLLATTSSFAAENRASRQDNGSSKGAVSSDPCDYVVHNVDCSPTEIIIYENRLDYRFVGQQKQSLTTGEAPQARLDQHLKALPGVGLFRRADSYTAHPTTQGLSMRGVGANAAGRVLVTLDGVPLNDPFGGWIYWSALALENTPEIQVLRGGGSGAFGAQALAGALDMRSVRVGVSRSRVSAWVGPRGSYNMSGRAVLSSGDTGLMLTAGRFETDGTFLFDENQRGIVDVRAASETTNVGAKLEHRFGDVRLKASARYFDEARINGLSLALNETQAFDVDLTLSGSADAVDWELVTYYRTRDFANVFVSARDGRTTERPVLDQFDVPAWGAGMLARLQYGGFEFGVDARRMSGETNERFRNLGAGFTRQRRAGGDQWVLGLYSEYGGEVAGTSYSATFRMDRWRTYGGERIETNIADGNLVREDTVPNRSDWIWSGRLGFERKLTGAINMRTAAYKSWRLPTLNEYYRPFRVVNDITEANANLVPEKLYGVEVGFDYQPLNTARLNLTLFRNWLTDGVGNVTVGFGPGFFPLGGFVPAGGVLRQRANIDQSITDGIELEGQLDFQNDWSLTARYLYARARITKFDARPELVGKRPVQTPRHGFTLAANYNGKKLSFSSEARFSSGQYDDDLNSRKLGSIFTLNVGAAYVLADKISITANVENLFDAKVVSAMTTSGLETLAQRRFARLGLEMAF